MDYAKPLKVNGKEYADGRIANAALSKYKGELKIELNYEKEVEKVSTDTQVRVKVLSYMCKQEINFHDKWNNGKPMPMRTMHGELLEETKGMYKMKLMGKVEPSTSCLHCNRELTNPVSFIYGIGPICGQHYNIAPPKNVREYKARKDEIKKKLEQATIWEGWVIKKAIEELVESKEEVDFSDAV